MKFLTLGTTDIKISTTQNLSKIALIVISLSSPLRASSPVDSILQSLTLEQKIGQMIMVTYSSYDFLNKYHIGSILIMKNLLENPDVLIRDLKKIQTRLPIPLLVSIDQEGGKVNRLSGLKKWKSVPSAKVLSSWAPDAISAYCERIALQLKTLGINTNLAPVLDPAVNIKDKKTFMELTDRSFGTGTEQIIPPAQAFVKGFKKYGVQCIAKHFPGYDVQTNSDEEIAHSDAESLTVADYVDIFYRMSPQLGGIMMSSIYYKKFCDEPAVFSNKMVQWARSMAGERIIMTDDLWGAALRSYIMPRQKIHPTHYPDSSFAKIVEQAVMAGNDILIITLAKKAALMTHAIKQMAYKNKTVQDRINRSVKRILLSKHKLGLI